MTGQGWMLQVPSSSSVRAGQVCDKILSGAVLIAVVKTYEGGYGQSPFGEALGSVPCLMI